MRSRPPCRNDGRLDDGGSPRALKALARFRVLARAMTSHLVLATAAARDATNGPAFLDAARRPAAADRAPVRREEAGSRRSA